MKIGIFGGSFNPPHMVHQQIVKELLEHHYVDSIVVVPAGDAYEKEGLVNGNHRYQMMKLNLEGIDSAMVSDYEVRNGKKYTYETLLHFQKKYPNATLFLIIGEDNLLEFDTWREYEWMLEHFHFLVIGRGNHPFEQLMEKYKYYWDHVIKTDLVTSDLSSTEVRIKLQNGDTSVEALVDPKVYSYIKEHHLYGVISE